MQPNVSRPRMFKVLTPIEKKDGTTFWMRVGSGFPGKDPSTINLYMDAMPTNGKGMLHIREMDEEDLQPREKRERRLPGAASSSDGGGNDLPF